MFSQTKKQNTNKPKNPKKLSGEAVRQKFQKLASVAVRLWGKNFKILHLVNSDQLRSTQVNSSQLRQTKVNSGQLSQLRSTFGYFCNFGTILDKKHSRYSWLSLSNQPTVSVWRSSIERCNYCNNCKSDNPTLIFLYNTRRLACYSCFFLAMVKNVMNGQTDKHT